MIFCKNRNGFSSKLIDLKKEIKEKAKQFSLNNKKLKEQI